MIVEILNQLIFIYIDVQKKISQLMILKDNIEKVIKKEKCIV